MAVKLLATCCLLAALTIALVQGQKSSSLLPTKGRECFGNTLEHVTRSMELLKAFRFAKLNENKNLSCISSCLLKKYGLMNGEGALDTLKSKKMVTKIREPTFRSVIDMRLSACIDDANSEDECQTAGKFVDCIAKSGSYKNWGNVIQKNFKNIFGSAPPPMEPSRDLETGSDNDREQHHGNKENEEDQGEKENHGDGDAQE